MLGPPGSGKGTQAKFITQIYGLPQISTGELLRTAAENESDLGLRAQEYMNEGKLVPDPLVLELLTARISLDDCEKGFILDGYPRNLEQAGALENFTPVNLVILIEVDRATLIQRITGRRTCKSCGAIFHSRFNPPQVKGVCDLCSGILDQRADDTEEIVIQRLQTYKRQTEPLIEYYKQKSIMRTLVGDGTIEEINAKLKELLDPLLAHLSG